jgi:hypothetical protein
VNIATMTPEQLAEVGIPAAVALRARLDQALQRFAEAPLSSSLKGDWAIRVQERRDAVAILEAKGER